MASDREIKKLNEIKDYILNECDLFSLKKEGLGYPPEYEEMINSFIQMRDLKNDLLSLIHEYNRILDSLPRFIKENHLFIGVENENNS